MGFRFLDFVSTGRISVTGGKLNVLALARDGAIAIVIVTGAWLLGSGVGGRVASKKQADLKVAREFQTKQIIAKMGTLAVGDLLPDQALEDLDMRVHRLSEIVHDTCVLVFFDPGCPACVGQIQQMSEFVVDPISCGRAILISGSNPLHLREFKARLQLCMPVLYDDNRMLQSNLRIEVTPFNIILSPDRRIIRIVAGTLDEKAYVELFGKK